MTAALQQAPTSDEPGLLTNVLAEMELLGALLIDNALFDIIADHVTAGDFAEPVHHRIYTAAYTQFAQSGFTNAASLKPLFDQDEGIKQLGGTVYLAKLSESGAGLFGAIEIAKQIADLAKRRLMIAGLRDSIAAAHDLGADLADAIGLADDAVSERDQDAVRDVSAAECFDEMLAAYDRHETGITCGLMPSLDHVLGRLVQPDLVIGAGRPGMGKTAVALSYARGAAEKGHGVLFVSLEMRGRQLAQRMAADYCYDRNSIPYATIRDGRLCREERAMIAAARDAMREIPLHVIDAGSLTTGRLNSLIRRKKRRLAARGQSLDLIIVDYLQLLRPDRREPDRYQAISEVSQSLKAMAKDNEVTIMALAQLSREVERRSDKRPMLSDLRDSGQIEQDADTVFFLLRDEYYLNKEEPPKNNEKYADWQVALADARGKIEFIVAKRRNGVEGTATGRFYGEYQAVRG